MSPESIRFVPSLALLVLLGSAPSHAAAPGASPSDPTSRIGEREVAAISEQDALGTLDATLDGDARQWYVVSGPAQDGPYASGTWMELGDTRLVVVGGLDDMEPGIETFSRGGAGGSEEMSLGAYAGSALNIVVEVGPDGAGTRVVDGSTPNQVIYLPDATRMDPEAVYSMSEGVVVLEEVTIADGTATARGSFSGRLERLSDGAGLEVADGRFEVEGLPNVDAITPP